MEGEDVDCISREAIEREKESVREEEERISMERQEEAQREVDEAIKVEEVRLAEEAKKVEKKRQEA